MLFENEIKKILREALWVSALVFAQTVSVLRSRAVSQAWRGFRAFLGVFKGFPRFSLCGAWALQFARCRGAVFRLIYCSVNACLGSTFARLCC